MTLQTDRLIAIASDERIVCCRRTFLALDTHAFCTGGDEHFSAGDEHVETCVRISITHTHSQLPATSKQNLYRAHLRKCALSRWGDPKVM